MIMKKLLIFIVVTLAPFIILAQETPLASLYSDFSSKSGYQSMQIKPGAMNLNWEKSEDFPLFGDMMKNIESISILQDETGSGFLSGDKLWKKVRKIAADERYTELACANGDEMSIRMFMMKSEENVVKEAAFCVKKDDKVILIAVSGNMDFSEMFNAENMQAMREMGEFFMEHKGSCRHKEH